MFKSEIKIGDFVISESSDPFIIAEVGINHNGEVEKAFQMIDLAKEAGASAVKFQTFKAREFVSDEKQMFTYYSRKKEVTESMLKMFERYEFNRDEWSSIKKYCVKQGIMFLSTPQNLGDLKLLLELGVDAVKVGSDDFTNLPLIKEYAKTNLPIILSCGMSDLGEVHKALEAINAFDGYPVILLLCVSEYPTPPSNVNILKLRTLKSSYPGLIVGFSDHTQGTTASVMGVALGGKVFEKHFTLDHDLEGPDHWFSENPEQLKGWIGSIKDAHKMLGVPYVRPTKKEKENKKEFQRYIVAKKSINTGEVLSHDNIEVKRITGGGVFRPEMFDILLGKKSHKNFTAGDAIDY